MSAWASGSGGAAPAFSSAGPPDVLWSEVFITQACRLFATPWTITRQAPLSMEFSRQEYWSGLPFPSPGDLSDAGIEPGSPALQADSLPSKPPGKPSVLWGEQTTFLMSCPCRRLCAVERSLLGRETQDLGCSPGLAVTRWAVPARLHRQTEGHLTANRTVSAFTKPDG